MNGRIVTAAFPLSVFAMVACAGKPAPMAPDTWRHSEHCASGRRRGDIQADRGKLRNTFRARDTPLCVRLREARGPALQHPRRVGTLPQRRRAQGALHSTRGARRSTRGFGVQHCPGSLSRRVGGRVPAVPRSSRNTNIRYVAGGARRNRARRGYMGPRSPRGRGARPRVLRTRRVFTGAGRKARGGVLRESPRKPPPCAKARGRWVHDGRTPRRRGSPQRRRRSVAT